MRVYVMDGTRHAKFCSDRFVDSTPQIRDFAMPFDDILDGTWHAKFCNDWLGVSAPQIRDLAVLLG